MTRQRRAALIGNPNAGKSALFNKLTGARQKIANYPGVTVERKAGRMILPSGEPIELIDLPGAYSFDAASPDEEVTRKVVRGDFLGEARPDVLVLVLDAANLEQHLVFAQEVIALGQPTIVALNMVDLAERDGLVLDPAALQAALGVPVIPTVAVRSRGLDALGEALDRAGKADRPAQKLSCDNLSMAERRLAARHMAKGAVLSRSTRHTIESRLDDVLLNPWAGPVILLALLFVVFQAVFAWATPFADALEGGVGFASETVTAGLPEGFARDLLTEGLLAGVGSVIVFLPQIVILFFFILVMEATGYMARAAFIMDRMMAGVGLSGRSFIPLLSSFACAIPGIMATRAIADEKDRLTTILVAPLMTCSARLPVYAVVIAAVIPSTTVGPGVGLQGLILFALYVAGIIGAMVVALVLRRTVTKGASSGFIMGDASLSTSPPARPGYRVVAASLDILAQGRHHHLRRDDHPLAAAELSQGRPGRKPGRCFHRRVDRQRHCRVGRTDRLQPRHRLVARAGNGRARGGRKFARHDLRGRGGRRKRWLPKRSPTGSPRAGRCPPRLPSSPGSCSHRNACPPLLSRSGKRTVGDGLPSWLAISSRWPTCSRESPIGARSLSGCSGGIRIMAGSLNKVMLIGNLGADPEIRSFQNGGRVANLRIATSRDLEGQGRATAGTHRLAHGGDLLRRAGERRRELPSQRLQGVRGGPVADPQVGRTRTGRIATRPKWCCAASTER